MKPTVVIHHDKRYVSRDGKSPVKIKVTFKLDNPRRWVRKFYGDGFQCTPGEFRSLSNPRSESLRTIKKEINKLYSKAVSIIDQNDELTIALFESRFFGIATDTVNGGFENKIERLKEEGRLGSASVYKTSLNGFLAYASKEEDYQLRFSEVTVDWIQGYQRESLKSGKSLNSIGISLRCLRAIFNYGITSKVIPPTLYPFKDFKIRAEKKFKIPLSDNDLIAFKNFKPLTEGQAEAKDYWFFSYRCNGMNMKDVCLLRRPAIQEEFLFYDRSKTRNTVINHKKIIIPLDDEMLAIIKRRGAKTLDPNAYVFPVLEDDLSQTTIKNRVQKFIKRINESLTEIADKCKIKKKLTTVIARHTYANRLLNSGVDKRIISEGLGHAQSETTEHYLGSMDIEKIKQARKAL